MQIRNFADIKGLLLDNKTIKQTIFKNTFWLAMAEGIGKLLKLALLIYVARILGATEYGKFSFAFAFIGLFAILSTFGLPRIIIRELSQEKEREKDFPAIFSLRILLGLGTSILILLGSFFITTDPQIQKIIWILALYTLLDSSAGFMNFFFQARQRMEYESWTKVFRAVLLVGFGFFVIFNFPSIQNLSYGYLLASLISLIFILLFFHFKVYPLRFSWNKYIWQRYLSMSWPIALAGAFTVIYSQIDSVMMGYWNLITETGWYNAAYRILGVALIPFGLISISFFPVLSQAFKKSKEEFQRVWNYQMGIIIFCVPPLIVGGIVLAPKIIGFIYGQSYASSILAFQILIIMVGILFFYNPFYQALLVFNQQKKFFLVSLSGAIINFILNLILIPKFSLYGAALATVVTSFVILLFYVGLTRRFTSVKISNLKFLWMGLLAIFSSWMMYFIISNLNVYNLHIFLSTIIGAAAYFTVFFVLKFIINYLYIRL